MQYGKKLYRFQISNNGETPLPLLVDPFYIKLNDDNKSSSMTKAIVPSTHFDSEVEENFARKFQEVVTVLTGWKLIREPDPLIVCGGKAFIPDFVFEKYDRKVYLEIVGFWTPEYLERKIQKIKDIVIDEKSPNNNNRSFASTVDLFIAIDEDLAGSKAISSSSLIPKDKLIFYKNKSLPIQPILNYLKFLDEQIIKGKVNDYNSKINFDGMMNVISIKELAEKNNNLPLEVTLKLALRDYGDRFIAVANGQYLISRSKVKELESKLVDITKFIEACMLLSENAIPDVCHAELLRELGFDVIWQSMDVSTAIIVKKQK
jgi:hypothetical protein